MSDTISKNRTLPVIEVSQLPAPSDEFKPSTAYDIQSLRKLAERSEAEAVLALEESVNLGDGLAKELGEDAPSFASLGVLLEKKRALIASKARLAFLLKYVEEQDDITNHDIAVALGQLTEEFEHKVKKRPALEEKFPALKAYNKSHSDSIKEGIARSKEKKEEKK